MSNECRVYDDIVSLAGLPDDDDNFVIVDVNFCDSKILKLAITTLNDLFPNHTITIIYFENDAKKCRHNVAVRNDGRNVEGTIKRFEHIYSPPADALKIHVA